MNKVPIILCVDDEKIILDTLSSQLNTGLNGLARLEVAQSVEDAWEIIQELHEEGEDLRMVISDWLMPPHRGDQFLSELHRNWPSVKLVMLSGQADEDATNRVKRLSSLLAFIKKPWEKEQILALAKSTL